MERPPSDADAPAYTGGLFRSSAPDPYGYAGEAREQRRPTQAPAASSQENQRERPDYDMQRRYDRVIKAFAIEPFDGSATSGSVDAGAAQWLQRFEALLGTHEDLNGIQLSDNVKNALMFQQLQGPASQWYISNIVELRSCTFDELGRRLKREFGSKLSRQEILIKVANERKHPSETYQQFSLRLRSMAAATTINGLETVESNNFALSALISNAWPRHSDSLRLIINEDSQDPLREIDQAVARLCTLSKSMGVAPSRASTRNTDYSTHRTDYGTRSVTGKRKASEQLVKKEKRQKEFKRPRRDYSKARCGECGELGHTTGYHDRFVARQQGMAHAAAQATKDADPDCDDPEFGQETLQTSE